ncbi:MAG: A24 family peptidase [Pirellulales bacterium]
MALTIGGANSAEMAARLWSGALSAFFIVYFFVVGGVVGSFLNVVVYRMPIGKNLLWPGSRCPCCDTPIRLTDNIPIISWLRLKGRCRACDCPIPPRYMLVELATATIFLGLALLELLSGGINLPYRPINPHGGVYWILWETKWDLVGIYLFHCCLASILISAGLIVWDGKLLPGRLVAFGLAVGLLLPLLFPLLRPLPWRADLNIAGTAWRGLVDGLLGYAAGILGGMLLNSAAIRGRAGLHRGRGSVDILAIVGAMLGWQAVVGVAVWTALGLTTQQVWSAARGVARRWPVGCMAAMAVSPQLALWRVQHEWLARFDRESGLALPLAMLASAALLWLTSRILPEPSEISQADEPTQGGEQPDSPQPLAPPEASEFDTIA